MRKHLLFYKESTIILMILFIGSFRSVFLEIFAQAIGIVAMVLGTLSYQQKQQKYLILCSIFGSLLFAVHFFLLKAYMGGLLNIICIFRGFVFLYRDKFKADHFLWVIFFEIVFILSYVATFTLLGTPFTLKNAIIEVLPIVGMTASTFSVRCKTTKNARILGLASSPAWLTYNIVVVAIGAICAEIVNLISITVGIIRLDIKKKDETN